MKPNISTKSVKNIPTARPFNTSFNTHAELQVSKPMNKGMKFPNFSMKENTNYSMQPESQMQNETRTRTRTKTKENTRNMPNTNRRRRNPRFEINEERKLSGFRNERMIECSNNGFNSGIKSGTNIERIIQNADLSEHAPVCSIATILDPSGYSQGTQANLELDTYLQTFIYPAFQRTVYQQNSALDTEFTFPIFKQYLHAVFEGIQIYYAVQSVNMLENTHNSAIMKFKNNLRPNTLRLVQKLGEQLSTMVCPKNIVNLYRWMYSFYGTSNLSSSTIIHFDYRGWMTMNEIDDGLISNTIDVLLPYNKYVDYLRTSFAPMIIGNLPDPNKTVIYDPQFITLWMNTPNAMLGKTVSQIGTVVDYNVNFPQISTADQQVDYYAAVEEVDGVIYALSVLKQDTSLGNLIPGIMYPIFYKDPLEDVQQYGNFINSNKAFNTYDGYNLVQTLKGYESFGSVAKSDHSSFGTPTNNYQSCPFGLQKLTNHTANFTRDAWERTMSWLFDEKSIKTIHANAAVRIIE